MNAPAPGPPPASAALDLARLGWAVLPVWPPAAAGCGCGRRACGSPGKHPLGTLASHGFKNATRNLATIRRWWSRRPDANVGIATGAVSGVVVLDVDPRHDGDGSLAALERVFGPLPPTVEARTGGGGRHLYFAAPAAPLPSRSALRPGLDMKAEGGYVVAPPSRHESGARYAWRPGHDPAGVLPAPLPSWLDALVRDRRAPRAGTPASAPPHRRDAFRARMARVGIIPRGARAEMHRCPFHDDANPSLSVDWEKAVFHCFGCDAGGGLAALRRLSSRGPGGHRA